jgi:hypothetical protein
MTPTNLTLETILTVLNLVLTIVALVFGFIFRIIFKKFETRDDRFATIESDVKQISQQLGSHELTDAESFVRKDDLRTYVAAEFVSRADFISTYNTLLVAISDLRKEMIGQFDKLEKKLDGKMDKP